MIAVVALFFFLSTPIENTEVVEGNYAQLLPNELFEMIEKESLAINPIVVSRKADTPKASAQKNTGQKAKKKVVTRRMLRLFLSLSSRRQKCPLQHL